MFHILIEDSTPNRLVGGPWKAINGSSSDNAPSILECGLRGGQVREAITQQEYKTLSNSGKLKSDKACKMCLQKAGGRNNGKRKNS